jgi:hypothetical protein
VLRAFLSMPALVTFQKHSMNSTNRIRPLLCAAALHAALLFSSNAAALDCIPPTPFRLATQYQQADYVGQLKVLAHGTETQNDKWFGRDLLKMKVELVGADVRGVQAATNRKPESNTQWAWLNASTAVGTVQDDIIARHTDFDAGKFYGGNVCISHLFAAGTLDSLLPPKGSGASVVLSPTDYTEVGRGFGLSADYFPAYVLVNADAPQVKPIALQAVKDGRRGNVQATNVPPGRYRIEPTFYPAGFSRESFSTGKGALTTPLLVIDRGAVNVQGGVSPDQMLGVSDIRTANAGTGQSSTSPALLMLSPMYKFELLDGAKTKSAFELTADSARPLIAGTYRVRTQLAGVIYDYGKDGVWQVKATDKNAAGFAVLEGFPKLDRLTFVTLRIDFKTADGEAISPDAVAVLAVAELNGKAQYSTTAGNYKTQGSSLYFKALKGELFSFSSHKVANASQTLRHERVQWRATADDAITIILK